MKLEMAYISLLLWNLGY